MKSLRETMNEDALRAARLSLLQGKTWRYLRYLHFRDALLKVTNDIETVCICGSGHGFAELAAAAEFPHIRFTLTDIINTKHGYPNYHRAMDMAWRHGVGNISFSVWNVLQPTSNRFDMVASTEMLEHIKDAERAAANMRAASSKYTYCLVPFADKATNADKQKRDYAWEKHEHYVYGYDAEDLARLFPAPIHIAGTYWAEGARFREKLTGMSLTDIEAHQDVLAAEASADIRDGVPTTIHDALGIRILSARRSPGSRRAGEGERRRGLLERLGIRRRRQRRRPKRPAAHAFAL